MEFVKKTDIMLDKYAKKSLQEVSLNHLRNSQLFITGATGLIGSTLIRALLMANRLYQINIKIVATARSVIKAKKMFSDFKDCEDLEIIEWDLSNDIICPITNFDYAIHTAAMTSSKDMVSKPVEVMSTTYEGTRRFLDFLKKNFNIKKSVVLSSLEIYGIPGNGSSVVSEDQYGYLDILSVRSSYPVAKRAIECLTKAYVEEYNVHACLARLSQTFGVGVDYNDGRVFAEFARRVVSKEDIVLRTEGKTERNYCALSDSVRALIFLLANGEDGAAYNVAGQDTYLSIYEMAQLFAQFSGGKTRVVISKEETLQYGYAPEMKIKLDTQKLETMGFCSKTNLKTMVSELIEWFELIKNERGL